MSNWSAETISALWNKATFISQENEIKGFRKDQCGAWINRSQYGNRDNKYGWEIDHVTPVSNGGVITWATLDHCIGRTIQHAKTIDFHAKFTVMGLRTWACDEHCQKTVAIAEDTK